MQNATIQLAANCQRITRITICEETVAELRARFLQEANGDVTLAAELSETYILEITDSGDEDWGYDD